MSFMRASIVRWFEEVAEKTVRKLKPGREATYTAIAVRLTSIGDVVFPWITHVANILSRRLSILQVTMIESMILASIWFGVVTLLLVLIAIVLG